ncbi:MAG: Ldh family oxidoreductase [Firmicutes bacterium]|nr:Ldh family oxidoreductase [Bacillota bacterium]
MSAEVYQIVKADILRELCVKAFLKFGVDYDDACVAADNLVTADLRGISSHGVARLKIYVDGLKTGQMIARPDIKIVRESPVSIVIDAGGGLGQPVSKMAMEKVIEKAGVSGVAFATVNNSNHYGIAGYYAMMAIGHDMIGISLTNTGVIVVPTFGRDSLLGTNPIAVAVPAGEENPFVLDMATSVVPRGKLEVYDRLEKEMPVGWATDEKGLSTTDAARTLKNISGRIGGGILPLGGEGELFSGHKGYGLAMLVEILSGVMAGANFSDQVYPRDEKGNPLPAQLGHFFGALRIDCFRDLAEFKNDMDILIRKMKDSRKAEGRERIYIHGEKEHECSLKYNKEGIPLHQKVINSLKKIAAELELECMLQENDVI